ncbi:hypothetical protein RTBOTA2_006478 [Rhodotorula toruloides]|uniref:Proteophosphoglycan ppg4 n=1 Tax=Rhodotorula toruloides TaxID=5286 RepID=A0A0K3CUE1_RHOTO|nr:hypothetical protein RTBOTA2_006478 [Rhodotorula toruloides]PRQ70307.1 hypothetical protein AAT19DRAFT_11056 [Rhodotorula toruloides]
MVCTPSTSTLTVALVASAALFAGQAEALPTSRSHSTIARRAHIATHHHVARSGTSLGDHSIVVDASTSSHPGSSGGIKNSTINLTSISRRRDSTLSTFSRVVRSLFGRAVPAAPATFTALPLTVSAPVSPSSSLKKRSAAHPKRRRNGNKLPRRGAPLKKLNRSTHAQRRAQDAQAATYPINVKLQRRKAAERAAVLEARAMNYTLADAQASAYSAAVAALSDSPYSPAVTALPTSASDSAAPTTTAYSTMLLVPTPASTADGNSPYTGDSLTAPNGTLGDAAAARALQKKQSVSTETVTQTVTLVAAPGIATPGPLGAASLSSSVSTTILNPKAAGSASPLTSSKDAQPTPSSAALPTSPPPSTATASPALQNVKSAFERRRMQPGRRAAIQHERAAKVAATQWFKA